MFMRASVIPAVSSSSWYIMMSTPRVKSIPVVLGLHGMLKVPPVLLVSLKCPLPDRTWIPCGPPCQARPWSWCARGLPGRTTRPCGCTRPCST